MKLNDFYKNYLNEILNRISIIFFAWFNCVIISYYYKETLVYIYVKPGNFLYGNKPIYFIYSSLNELFYTYFKIIFLTVNIFVTIFLVFQTLLFVTPGLRLNEYKFIRNVCILSITFYLFLMSLNYHIILPFSWEFFLNFQNNIDKNTQISFYFEANLDKYIEMVSKLIYICNYNIILIIIVSFSIYFYDYDIVYYSKNYKKSFYLIILILSSIITPPDIMSQISISFINVINFEILVYLLLIQKNLFKVTN